MRALLLAAAFILSACATEPAPEASKAATECVKASDYVDRFAGLSGIQHAVFTEGPLARVLFFLNHHRPDTMPEVKADRMDVWRLGNQERVIFSLAGCITYSETDTSGEFRLSRFINRALGERAA